MSDSISFTLNDKPVSLNVDGERRLLWVLRTDLGLTGTKFGCGQGHCGCCTVMIDKTASRSCLTKVKSVQGKSVVTIEGLERDGKLHPLQKAFVEHDGMQCGFCTPGMIMTGVAFLGLNPDPSEDDVLLGMEHNICRCGAHKRIVQSVMVAAAEMKGGK